MFTGTLIEDLIATVERVEQQARAEEIVEMEIWFTSGEANAGCEANLLGVAYP